MAIALAPYTTFGVVAEAREILPVQSVDDVCQAVTFLGSAPYYILGGGSNVLVASTIDQPVVHIQFDGIEVVEDGVGKVDVHVLAGTNWHSFVEWSVAQGLGGLETLAYIPGTVGAAPMQNIGAYGSEQQSCCLYVDVVYRGTGRKERIKAADCEFGYRTSVFKTSLAGQVVIVGVGYRLQKQPTPIVTYADVRLWLQEHHISQPSVADVFDAVVDVRKHKLPDPKELGNAGSFFKNPVVPATQANLLFQQHPTLPRYETNRSDRIKLAAAWLIDVCGWKGYRQGNVGVHAKQALVLVNYGGATGGEVLALATAIEQSVYETFGVNLEREVNVWR
jgi:UDP-N-acetylmuramate dehydrogenase